MCHFHWNTFFGMYRGVEDYTHLKNSQVLQEFLKSTLQFLFKKKEKRKMKKINLNFLEFIPKKSYLMIQI